MQAGQVHVVALNVNTEWKFVEVKLATDFLTMSTCFVIAPARSVYHDNERSTIS